MTKLRPPLSFERALVRIADHIGFEAMGAAIGKAARTVMDYADHDVPTGICLEDAFHIEAAYKRAGGEGAPISDCWRTRLDMVGTVADRDQLLTRTVEAIKEGAEATAALVVASRPGATRADRLIARREVEQSIAAQTSTLALLEDGTGPDEASSGQAPGGVS